MFSTYLSAKGHDCIVTNNSKNGLNFILKQNFDMVLLDLAMPELSGYDIIDHLEKVGIIKRMKIVVFSAMKPTEEEISKLLMKGVYCFMKKPVELDDLNKIITDIEQN